MIALLALLSCGLAVLVFAGLGDRNDASLPILIVVFLVFAAAGAGAIWQYVLARESQRDSQRLMSDLQGEIARHETTDAKLNEAIAAAEAASEAKSKYVSNLSHELRTPLNVILGYAQLLERMEADNAVIQAAKTIKRSGDHLAGMIEGLLDISKIEAGHMELYRDTVVLQPFLEQLADMFTLLASDKGIAFSFNPQTALPGRVTTDEKRLRQVLINILSNAVKFTKAGSVDFGIAWSGQVATFTIKDTGVGIAARDMERIFQPFERLEKTQDESGTGLGLTITKLLVDMMGGNLVVDSQPGAGTTVKLQLMLATTDREAEVPTTTGTVEGYVGRTRTIVLADDDSGQRALIKDMLDPLGFRVIAVEDGAACLSAITLHSPDLIILDVEMPNMSGWQVATRARRILGDQTPIVMMSAHTGEMRNNPNVRKNYDAYIVKPFQYDHLVDTLGSLLNLNWSQDHTVSETRHELPPTIGPDTEALDQLTVLGRAGLIRSAEAVIRDIERENPDTAEFCADLYTLLKTNQIDLMVQRMEDISKHADS